MRTLTIVGTRPQLIKAAALQPALPGLLVDTGQHWDDNLAGSFFRELGLREPDYSLHAGSQIGTMLAGLTPILEAEAPDAVVVFGDTNSTLAGALAASQAGIPVAHIEAGLRSFDRTMPEERNRVVADHLAHWLFAPNETAAVNLAAEGISERVHLVGDLMEDMCAQHLWSIPGLAPVVDGPYLYATVHRAENREPDAIEAWAALLARVATPERPVVLALHPGTRAVLHVDLPDTIRVIDPVGYRESLSLALYAAAVLTDSGGLQREAAWLGTPCLILRSVTEWPGGALVGLDADLAARALGSLVRQPPLARLTGAAEAIAQALGA